jgi:hypothetical protein
MPGDQNALNGPAAESFAIRMAALTLLQACAFATGTKFTAIVFAVLGNAFADFDFAIAIGMSTTLFSHDSIPPMWGGAVLMPLRGEKIRAVPESLSQFTMPPVFAPKVSNNLRTHESVSSMWVQYEKSYRFRN